MALPVVAIVGRPNVGKSSLLNMLARERISIVDPRAGITRDRVSTIIEHAGRYIELVDTGGIGIVDADHLESHVEQQIQYALDKADVVLFVVDVREGLTPLDRQAAERLRRLDRPVVLVANKVDQPVHEPLAAEFGALGFGDPVTVSAAHGWGRPELLDRLLSRLPPGPAEPPAEPVMKLAIVGKRNAGKSTLVNALAGEPRVIVSETPGTTRDAVDVRFRWDGRELVAIDTAGVRKRRSMQDIDFYSFTRAVRSIRRADVVVLLIDATVAVSEVDLKLARTISDEYKPLVLAVNKWDLVGERATTADYGRYLTQVLPWVDYAPIVFIAAGQGRNLDALVDVALSLHRQARQRVPTHRLNEVFRQIIAQQPAVPRRGGRELKFYYFTQISTAPPVIVGFCNFPELVSDSYRRYLESQARQRLPFAEIPFRLLWRARRGAGQRPARRARAADS